MTCNSIDAATTKRRTHAISHLSRGYLFCTNQSPQSTSAILVNRVGDDPHNSATTRTPLVSITAILITMLFAQTS
jgi:hypothetical protein